MQSISQRQRLIRMNLNPFWVDHEYSVIHTVLRKQASVLSELSQAAITGQPVMAKQGFVTPRGRRTPMLHDLIIEQRLEDPPVDDLTGAVAIDDQDIVPPFKHLKE